jgi:UDP-N-acetylmuramate dehydrogenase
LVVRLDLRGTRFEDGGDRGLVVAAAGEPWDQLVAESIARGLGGLECLSGIPGSVGATPIQNVGAYGQEVAEVIESVEVVPLPAGTTSTIAGVDCGFGYRDSRFKRAPGSAVVTEVRFRLRPDAAPVVRYPQLRRAIDSQSPTLAATRDAVLALRRDKSMVIEQGDPNRRSVGSFFTNPVVATEAAAAIVARAIDQHMVADPGDVPRYDIGPGQTKLAAAWLIEHAGIAPGYRRGPVGVSSRHTLALVHHGGGTTRALLDLARHIRQTVRDTWGVELVPEPTIVGDAL